MKKLVKKIKKRRFLKKIFKNYFLRLNEATPIPAAANNNTTNGLPVA